MQVGSRVIERGWWGGWAGRWALASLGARDEAQLPEAPAPLSLPLVSHPRSGGWAGAGGPRRTPHRAFSTKASGSADSLQTACGRGGSLGSTCSPESPPLYSRAHVARSPVLPGCHSGAPVPQVPKACCSPGQTQAPRARAGVGAQQAGTAPFPSPMLPAGASQDLSAPSASSSQLGVAADWVRGVQAQGTGMGT